MPSDREVEAAARAHYNTGQNIENPYPARWDALNEYGKTKWRVMMKAALEAAEKVRSEDNFDGSWIAHNGIEKPSNLTEFYEVMYRNEDIETSKHAPCGFDWVYNQPDIAYDYEIIKYWNIKGDM